MAAKKKTTTKKAAKTEVALRPIKETLTKSSIVSYISEQTELSRKQVAAVLSSFENIILGSVHPKGSGVFNYPGVMKVSLRKVPARKAGTLIRNPATGEMMKAAAKPASVRVKIRPLKKLKSAAIN